MWENYLTAVKKEQEKYGESINPGLSDNDIDKLTDLPDSLINFLKKVNGLEYNGYILYGFRQSETPQPQPIYDIYDYNEIWHENDEMDKYLFIGESNISWYVYNLKSKLYEELDNPSGRLVKRFDTLDELLEQVLKEALEN